MNRPTLTQCQEQLAAFAAHEQPEDWVTGVNPTQVGDATLTVLTVFWEGTDANAVPREAQLVFGGDNRLLWLTGLDPGMFMHATEEGFDIVQSDQIATRRLAGLEALWSYLKGQAYELADCS